MEVARVVTFEGVSNERVEEMRREMSEGEAPEGMPTAQGLVLHDPDTETSLVIMIFKSEEDYQRAHEILDAMPAADTPGRRTSVKKYDLAARYES
jgi:hypothetical protein